MKILILILCTVGFCQAQVHPKAHAHNDYEHQRPLFDALANGFANVEADVYLIDGRLIVSHEQPAASSARTLEALYLKPLDSLVRNNKGSVYPNYKGQVLLMIDIKTNGESTFIAIQKILDKYKSILQTPDHKGAVRVFISGNRPIDLIKNDVNHYASIDGRPSDIGKGFTEAEMPVISDSFKNVISWDGKGNPSKEELAKLKKLAEQVHAENKKLRLWATPDNENAWAVLLNAGVDLINTDKLAELNAFLTSRHL